MESQDWCLKCLNSGVKYDPNLFELIEPEEFEEKQEELMAVIERFEEYLTQNIEKNRYTILGFNLDSEFGVNFVGLAGTLLLTFVEVLI